jgi:hypothetical protein
MNVVSDGIRNVTYVMQYTHNGMGTRRMISCPPTQLSAGLPGFHQITHSLTHSVAQPSTRCISQGPSRFAWIPPTAIMALTLLVSEGPGSTLGPDTG